MMFSGGVKDQNALCEEGLDGMQEEPQEPELASADMTLEEYDPGMYSQGAYHDVDLSMLPAEDRDRLEREALALAEPEPLEEYL